MSDRETNALREAVKRVTPDPALSRVHPAVVRGQRSDGTIDVDLDEGGPAPRMSGVEPVYGLPATRCRFKAGARLLVAYKAGDPRNRISTHYVSYPPVVNPELVPIPDVPVEEINIANAATEQRAARQGDATGNGKLIFTQAPVGPGGVPSTLTITYQPPSGPPVQVLTFPIPGPAVMFALSPTAPNPLIAEVPLSGTITSGSTIVKIGG